MDRPFTRPSQYELDDPSVRGELFLFGFIFPKGSRSLHPSEEEICTSACALIKNCINLTKVEACSPSRIASREIFLCPLQTPYRIFCLGNYGEAKKIWRVNLRYPCSYMINTSDTHTGSVSATFRSQTPLLDPG